MNSISKIEIEQVSNSIQEKDFLLLKTTDREKEYFDNQRKDGKSSILIFRFRH